MIAGLWRRRLPRTGQSTCALPCCRPARPELRRVAAEQDHPRLHITCAAPGWWTWAVTGPQADVLDSGWQETHRQALAVGLAALETASLTR